MNLLGFQQTNSWLGMIITALGVVQSGPRPMHGLTVWDNQQCNTGWHGLSGCLRFLQLGASGGGLSWAQQPHPRHKGCPSDTRGKHHQPEVFISIKNGKSTSALYFGIFASFWGIPLLMAYPKWPDKSWTTWQHRQESNIPRGLNLVDRIEPTNTSHQSHQKQHLRHPSQTFPNATAATADTAASTATCPLLPFAVPRFRWKTSSEPQSWLP